MLGYDDIGMSTFIGELGYHTERVTEPARVAIARTQTFYEVLPTALFLGRVCQQIDHSSRCHLRQKGSPFGAPDFTPVVVAPHRTALLGRPDLLNVDM